MTIAVTGARAMAAAALSCALAAVVVAATPTAQLIELDEVLVTARDPLPLEDFVKFPKYESVAISPNGTRAPLEH